jgi:hypothetical protein
MSQSTHASAKSPLSYLIQLKNVAEQFLTRSDITIATSVFVPHNRKVLLAPFCLKTWQSSSSQSQISQVPPVQCVYT